MNNKSLRDNPIWLYIGSLLIFSFFIALLLFFRESLFQSQQKQQTQHKPTPTAVTQLSIAIPVLERKQYFPSAIKVERTVATNSTFTSQVISFTVDGLKEYALLDTPVGEQPAGGYPVLILNHGYINPQFYDTVSSYAGPTNFFASQGFIVIKPDYRGNGNSEGFGDPLKRFDYPTDVITVIASLKNIPHANTQKVYLWGHSMGGEVTLEVSEIVGKQQNLGRNVKAVVLWAPVTDPAKWFSPDNLKKIPEAVLTPFPYQETFKILGEPSENAATWQSINPLQYLSDINTPVQLNHGTGDQIVPYSWSVEFSDTMRNLGKQIDFISYPGADHNLSPDTTKALQNSLQFFNTHK